jgi:hypothetical protein
MKKLIFPTLVLMALGACKSDPLEDPSTTTDCSNGPELTLVSSSNTSCGLAIGSIVVNATGGEGSLDYSIDGNDFQANGDFDNLAAGTYTVTVKDVNDCTNELEVTIGNNDGVNLSLQADDAGCNTSNGEIRANATDGVRPYQFKLESSGTYQPDSVFTGLTIGNYQVFVKDNDGCEVSQSITLTTGVQFAAVKAIVSSNCAISGCHNGSVSPNLTVDANIQDRAGRIKARTGAMTMPPSASGITLSAQEIETIACWVDDGANL